MATILEISSPADLKAAQLRKDYQGLVILAASDWRMIPAENLVAAFQARQPLFECPTQQHLHFPAPLQLFVVPVFPTSALPLTQSSSAYLDVLPD